MSNDVNEMMPGYGAREEGGKDLATVVYALQALAVFNGLTAIAGVIINYLKFDDIRGTWVESHFRWQVRTFWYGLLWGAIGFVLSFVLIGFLVLGILTIWFIYRIVRGWLALSERRPVEPLKTFL